MRRPTQTGDDQYIEDENDDERQQTVSNKLEIDEPRKHELLVAHVDSAAVSSLVDFRCPEEVKTEQSTATADKNANVIRTGQIKTVKNLTVFER